MLNGSWIYPIASDAPIICPSQVEPERCDPVTSIGRRVRRAASSAARTLFRGVVAEERGNAGEQTEHEPERLLELRREEDVGREHADRPCDQPADMKLELMEFPAEPCEGSACQADRKREHGERTDPGR